jgi:hypothetical protein
MLRLLRVVVVVVSTGSVLVSCGSANMSPVGVFYNGDPPPVEYQLCKNGTGWESDNNGPRKQITWSHEGDKVTIKSPKGRGYDASTGKMVNGDLVFTPTSGPSNTFKRKSDKDC